MKETVMDGTRTHDGAPMCACFTAKLLITVEKLYHKKGDK